MHHLAGRQRMNAMRAFQAPDLAHYRFHFTRLDVGDVHIDAAFEMRQFMAERRWAEVPADARELALFVAEGGFDDQVSDLHRAQTLPEQWVRPGVAGEDPPSRSIRPAAVFRAARCSRAFD